MSIRIASLVAAILLATTLAVSAEENQPPKGFTALFNGQDFTNWHGQKTMDPRAFSALSEEDRSKKLSDDAADFQQHWKVADGEIVNDGKGVYCTTDRDFGDIELFVDYKMLPKGDSGIYLRATPQVQIWDYIDPDKFKLGADKGSGGLWNNSAGSPGKDPLVLADKKFGEWNTFRILQTGARTTVELNDKLVVDHATWENFWDKSKKNNPPLAKTGPIQLQTHGSEIRWRNIFVREIPADEANRILASHGDDGFESVFDGTSLDGWEGARDNYEVVDGAIRCKAGKGGVLFTKGDYGDFVARLEFKVPPGGNNGLAIRFPGEGKDAAYGGMCELQVLDDGNVKYEGKLDPRQYHGSAYGMVSAARGYLRPNDQWNFEEVTVCGSKIKVELNGTVILDTDLADVKEFMGGRPHPGKDLTHGHFGFAGHNDPVAFRKIRIKKLD